MLSKGKAPPSNHSNKSMGGRALEGNLAGAVYSSATQASAETAARCGVNKGSVVGRLVGKYSGTPPVLGKGRCQA